MSHIVTLRDKIGLPHDNHGNFLIFVSKNFTETCVRVERGGWNTNSALPDDTQPNGWMKFRATAEHPSCSAPRQPNNADETDNLAADESATARRPAKRCASALFRDQPPARRKSVPGCRDVAEYE